MGEQPQFRVEEDYERNSYRVSYGPLCMNVSKKVAMSYPGWLKSAQDALFNEYTRRGQEKNEALPSRLDAEIVQRALEQQEQQWYQKQQWYQEQLRQMQNTYTAYPPATVVSWADIGGPRLTTQPSVSNLAALVQPALDELIVKFTTALFRPSIYDLRVDLSADNNVRLRCNVTDGKNVFAVWVDEHREAVLRSLADFAARLVEKVKEKLIELAALAPKLEPGVFERAIEWE